MVLRSVQHLVETIKTSTITNSTGENQALYSVLKEYLHFVYECTNGMKINSVTHE